MTAYTCIACAAPVTTAAAVIVGVDVAGYPAVLPVNVVACRGCEDRARRVIALQRDNTVAQAGGNFAPAQQ